MSWAVKTFLIIWHWWFRLSDKIRFVLVGGFNACVQYAIYVILLLIWDEEHYQSALIASWILSTFSSFTTQKIFVFRTLGNWLSWVKEYVKCLGVWIISYLINALMLWFFVGLCGINPYLGQIIAVACTTISSYILMKYFAFKK